MISKGRLARWALIACAGYAGFCAIWITAGLALDRDRVQRIDVTAASALAADYSVDEHAVVQPPLDPQVIDAAAADAQALAVTPTPVSAGFDPLPRVDRAQPADTLTPTATPSPVLEPTETLEPTQTHTPEPTDTPEATETPTPEPTGTLAPTETPPLTETSEPSPTATKTPACVDWGGGTGPENGKRRRCTPTPTPATDG